MDSKLKARLLQGNAAVPPVPQALPKPAPLPVPAAVDGHEDPPPRAPDAGAAQDLSSGGASRSFMNVLLRVEERPNRVRRVLSPHGFSKSEIATAAKRAGELLDGWGTTIDSVAAHEELLTVPGLMYALCDLASYEGHTEAAAQITGHSDLNMYGIMWSALADGLQPSIAKILVGHRIWPSSRKGEWNVLHQLAQAGDPNDPSSAAKAIEIARVVVTAPEHRRAESIHTDINDALSNGYSPLDNAVAHGRLELAAEYLALGATISEQTRALASRFGKKGGRHATVAELIASAR